MSKSSHRLASEGPQDPERAEKISDARDQARKPDTRRWDFPTRTTTCPSSSPCWDPVTRRSRTCQTRPGSMSDPSLPAQVRSRNRRRLLPGPASTRVYFGDLFAEEVIEAIRYRADSFFLHRQEGPPPDKLWVGAANDVIFRNGASNSSTARRLASPPSRGRPDPGSPRRSPRTPGEEPYAFMVAYHGGRTSFGTASRAGVQIGWSTRLVPFGPDDLGRRLRAGVRRSRRDGFRRDPAGRLPAKPIYNKDRIFAFA